jgi:radical SAM enzyme (TIGR01210 family)
MYLIANLNLHLPNLNILAMETRPEFVDMAELEFIHRALQEGATPTILEIVIGFEAFDDSIRNTYFHKGLSLETFEDLVKKLAKYNYRLKCYFMLKPVPGITDKQACEDIHQAIDYLNNIQKKYNIIINMHINPTYVAKGTAIEDEFIRGNYTPPNLFHLAQAAKYARNKGISIYLGLSDEGLAAEGGSFLKLGEEGIINKLEEFNKTANFDILESLCKGKGL